jgi:hypothetical protein
MVERSYALDGLLRLSKVVPNLDERTRDIIAYHLHLEREMDMALKKVLPRPERLKKLSFVQKVGVLEALSDSAWIDRVGTALMAFNNLRNSAAHASTSKVEIDGCFSTLCEACGAITEDHVDDATATVGGLAAGICGALGVDVEARPPLSGALTPEILSLRLGPPYNTT